MESDDLAFALLADFANPAMRDVAIERAKFLAAELPEDLLRLLTEQAASIVDRAFPAQSFRFRATLTLVSMIATDPHAEPEDCWLADPSAMP
jgi:hypothetical protein